MNDLKTCKKCGIEKAVELFSKNKRRKDGLQDHCKACIKIRDAENYKKNPDKFAKWSKSRRLEVREKVFTYLLDHPCVECGERDIVVLEFDHRTQTTKKFDVMSATHGHSWKTILEEIKKCDVVCANCHKRRTAKMLNWETRLKVAAAQKEQIKAEQLQAKKEQATE